LTRYRASGLSQNAFLAEHSFHQIDVRRGEGPLRPERRNVGAEDQGEIGFERKGGRDITLVRNDRETVIDDVAVAVEQSALRDLAQAIVLRHAASNHHRATLA
jgi:hypothetical protein